MPGFRVREHYAVFGDRCYWKVITDERVSEESAGVCSIKFSILQTCCELDGGGHGRGNFETILNHVRSAWWDLMIVEFGENVFGVAAIDPCASTIEDIGVDKVRPWIESTVAIAKGTAATDGLALSRRDHVEPDLIRICGPLRK